MSHAFIAFNSHIVDAEGLGFFSDDDAPQEIVGLTLPAGSYVIWASLHERDSGDVAVCRVEKAGAPIDLPSGLFFLDGNTTTTTVSVITSATTFQIFGSCLDRGDSLGLHNHPIVDGTMTAIRVDQVN